MTGRLAAGFPRFADRPGFFRSGRGVVSKPGGLFDLARAWADRLVNELDEPWPVDQFDGMFGDEFLRRQRKRPRGDKETLVASRVMNRSQKLLKFRRADDPFRLILALNDGHQAAPFHLDIGPLVSSAADALHVVTHGLEHFRDELLETFGRERGELSELEVGPFCLAKHPFDTLTSFDDGFLDGQHVVFEPGALGGFEAGGVPIGFEEGVFTVDADGWLDMDDMKFKLLCYRMNPESRKFWTDPNNPYGGGVDESSVD